MRSARTLVAGLALVLLLVAFAAFGLLASASDPAERLALLGVAFASGVGMLMCWLLLALERLAAR